MIERWQVWVFYGHDGAPWYTFERAGGRQQYKGLQRVVAETTSQEAAEAAFRLCRAS